MSPLTLGVDEPATVEELLSADHPALNPDNKTPDAVQVHIEQLLRSKGSTRARDLLNSGHTELVGS
ncbi:MAG: hypothetical protein KC680_02275 [Candidatus Peregrinibacteria bacterium]|nr:hypothetical protein [Candidatus Peregrinibacteria bacterium]MCB9808692.1 hypothetical protein [Candidatus Peribacteria bacterium]